MCLSEKPIIRKPRLVFPFWPKFEFQPVLSRNVLRDLSLQILGGFIIRVGLLLSEELKGHE